MFNRLSHPSVLEPQDLYTKRVHLKQIHCPGEQESGIYVLNVDNIRDIRGLEQRLIQKAMFEEH